MAVCGRLLAFLTLLAILLPSLPAQEKDAKPDPEKDKKKETKKTEPAEKLVYGQIITAKLKRMDANSARDFAIEIPVYDAQKAAALGQWQAQQMMTILRDPNPASRAKAMQQFQVDLARKQSTELYATKDLELRAAGNCKVRTVNQPVEYDIETGKIKKWTQKELAALRGSFKPASYPAEFDVLRVGQTLQVYLAKQAVPNPMAKGKKKTDDDEIGVARSEVVLIIVIQDAPAPK